MGEDTSVEPDTGGPVVLFDGVCNLCVGSVQWLLRMDRRERLRFGTLQSDAGSELLRTVGLSGEYDGSIVLVESGNAYTESDAVLRIAWLLGFPWALGSVLSIVPKSVRDRGYRFIAGSRYEWFGKRERCLVPDEELGARFVD
jgi:predicted DCC family thiol-disulfide oxidoreductase YuxK